MIAASPVALTPIPPLVVDDVSAFAMNASTSFEISLCAIAAAIETVPAKMPTAAASEAAPVIARIVGVSLAMSEMLEA